MAEDESLIEAQQVEEATYLWVAETVLRKHKRPLRSREIVNFGIADGFFGDRQLSRTPQKSMQARLSTDILQKGPQSRFLRTSRGLFYLRRLVGEESHSSDPITEYTAVRRVPAPPSENVLVIEESGYREFLDFQGIELRYKERLQGLLHSASVSYLPRTSAETDDRYKQFITYAILQDRHRILMFRRGTYSRTASFLRGAACIGFGGHVTDQDWNLFSSSDMGLRANAAREISEEVKFDTVRLFPEPSDMEILGILNDDSSDVGRRHLAVVMRYWLPNSAASWRPVRGEASVRQLRWLDTRSADISLHEFEYWSQLCLRQFYSQTVASKPMYTIARREPFKGDHLLFVIGAIGSGKSIATRYLRERAGYQEVNSGRVLARLLGLAPVPDTPRQLFQEAALEYISQPNGPSRLAESLLEEARATSASRVVIDGIRHPETLIRIRERANTPTALLYIHTPPDVAYELYKNREAPGQAVSPIEFMRIYNAPVEGQIRYFRDDADALLFNWFGMENYRMAIANLISDLRL